MPMLVDLPGVSSGKLEAVVVRSRTAAIKELRHGTDAITAASDEGAINVWIDDESMYRCEFHRRKDVLESKTFRHLAAVDQWLREWLPQMERTP